MVDFTSIQTKIHLWYQANKRSMPWRETKDPYTIWLSEIILQQTQISQGLPYFEKFILAFPNLKNLAEAKEEAVLKLWQGLGYYSRARNLHQTAQHIFFNLGNRFPENYEDLLKLKGVGEYTAAAISSIAFSEPKAVVDGNVVRLISRLFKIEEPFNKAAGKSKIKQYAAELLNVNHPGEHNQAMMEIGSTICKPQNPKCSVCPLEEHCLAWKDKVMDQFPARVVKMPPRVRYLNFFVPILTGHKTLLTKRTEKDIWKNMYTFPLFETKEDKREEQIMDDFKTAFHFNEAELLTVFHLRHILSHQILLARFYVIRLKEDVISRKNNTFEAEIKNINEIYPFPRLITKFLENKEISVYFD